MALPEGPVPDGNSSGQSIDGSANLTIWPSGNWSVRVLYRTLDRGTRPTSLWSVATVGISLTGVLELLSINLGMKSEYKVGRCL